MKDKLILKDQTTLEIEAGASLSSITVLSSTKEEMIEKWDKLTKENLSSVEIKNSEDVLIARYENLILVNETSTILEDGTISTSFNLREKTDVEKLQEEVSSLGEKSDMLEASILELSEVVYE